MRQEALREAAFALPFMNAPHASIRLLVSSMAAAPARRLSESASMPPPLESTSAEPALEVVPLPEAPAAPSPPPAAPASPTKTKYPAMMVSGSSSAPVLDAVALVDEDLGPRAPPRFLVPPDVQSAEDVEARARAAKESEIPDFKGSYLGRFSLVSANSWTSGHLSERPRSVDAFSGTRARGTLTLKRH